MSTEDKEIAEVACKYGAEVIDRPVELAQDNTLIQPVLEQVIDALGKEGYVPDAIILLNPTAPMRDADDINRAAYLFINGSFDTLFSVYAKITCVWTMGENGYEANYDYLKKTRRQDMRTQYRENGAIYMVRREFLQKNHHFLGGKMAMSHMIDSHSVDIDTELDFIMAEAVMNAYLAYKSKIKSS